MRQFARRGVGPLIVFGLAVVSLACGVQPELAQTSAASAAAPARGGGRIRGVITFRGDPPASRMEQTGKDTSVCGASVPVTRLSLGPGNTVRQAFVYLDKVPSDAVVQAVQSKGPAEVEQRNCTYGPHVMTMLMGGDIAIVNSDPILHNVLAKADSPDGPLTVFNIAQPMRGQRTKIEAPLTKPGIVALTCEAGHPWMTAYIFVANHPFVATTGDSGEFVIEHVPPGSYPIRMWHEGVRLTRMIPSLQQYEYEAPYESTQEVTVPADGEVVVNFALELRPTN